ncbi:MAG: copper homeostasis protein CutC [Bacteroidetes bacterium]|nr:copper homeostasis protein CutC [Bacteroidota bacterium]
MLLELATFNIESVHIAVAAGVHRLELCEDYTCGGVTPSLNYFNEARKLFHDKIFVMIRPRPGSFVYSDQEFETMLRSLEEFKSLGADGFVCGFMNDDQTINENQLGKFIEQCQPFFFTFHRAFDQVRDWKLGLDILLKYGYERVLTSGDGKTAEEGMVRLKEMIDYVKGELMILPGGGIRSSNLESILDACQPEEIHTAGITQENLLNGKFIADENELMKMLVMMK